MEANIQPLSEIALLMIDITSHALPFLAHLTHLKSQGISFDFYGPAGFKDIFGKLPQNFFEFRELVCRNEGFTGIFRSILEGYLKTVPAIEALWEERKYKPKLIIADMAAPFALPLARKLGIPLVVLQSTHCFPRFKEFPEVKPNEDETLIALGKQVKEKYGLTVQTLNDTVVEGDKNISCLPKFLGELFVPSDDDFVYLGPGLRDEDDAQVLELDPEFLKDNDIIYVSLGTNSTNVEGFAFYENVIEALKDTEHKVLISAAIGRAEELIAKGLPKNIIVKSWVP